MLREANIQDFDSKLFQLQKEFPAHLKSHDVYYSGSIPDRNYFHLGIVGSRRPSLESLKILDLLLSQLKNFPIRIVSGGALGVDAQAHATAMRYKIPTYSWVVGDPMLATPYSNRELFNRIAAHENSAILTPRCLYRHKNQGLFPSHWLERNQWVAANSDILLVIQAKEFSGTWSTVKSCQTFGVSTFAIAGSPVDACYSGNNLMISMSYASPIHSLNIFMQELIPLIKDSYVLTEKISRDHINRDL